LTWYPALYTVQHITLHATCPAVFE
jgi:hypothetical protein